MMKARLFVDVGAVACLCAALVGACRSRERPATASSVDASTLEPPAGRELRPVTLPDFSHMNEPAKKQMQARYSSLRSRIVDRGATAVELASAYGEMGKLLMAATYFDAAESCYLNAQALAPTDSRWPYYLGHLYKVKGPIEKSAASFERALQLQPNDVATLVWLGDAYVTQGRAEAADPLFARVLSRQPDSAAALFGAGRAALARRDYPRAVKDLEEALAQEPQATAIHYPLAMAYRGLGNVEKAQAHLAQRGDIETRPADPLMWEVDGLLQSAEAYNVRGGRELDAGHWAAAAEYFRKGLELAPADPSLRHRLGTALFQMGDAAGAAEQFEQVIKTSPEFARAHFSLGVLMEASGRHQEAIDRLSAALKYDPGYFQARVQLAGILARNGRPEEALAQYKGALEKEPTDPDAAFGYAMTLVRLHRYQEARDRLVDGMKAHSDQPNFSHALARLLAAAPDDRVRDGRRAKALVDELFKQQQSFELGETAAMTLAELGQYAQAAAVQRDIMAAAEKAGVHDVVRRMSENLKLYEVGKPCRTPFTEDEMP
jgi:tetratricopeptide (TPR) repeat protein